MRTALCRKGWCESDKAYPPSAGKVSWNAGDRRGESQRWLHRNGFRFDGYYNGDKTLLTPDALIDDRPVTLEAMAAKGVTVIHPDHAYCTAAPGRVFRRWAAVPLILEGVR